jgi:hypothetical protein
VGGWFSGCGSEVGLGRFVLEVGFGDGWGMVGQIKVREITVSAISPLLLCSIAIGAVLLRRSGDKRDVLADVPFVIRRPWPRAWRGLGLLSGGVVFPELSKLLNQEDALGAPCLDTVILAPRRRPRGRRNTADRRHPSLRCHITACYTGHQAGKR